MMMSKKNLVIVVVVVLVVIAVGLFINKKGTEGNAYSVVYMSSGEVYIGKLSTFGGLELTEAYVLQVIKDEKDATKSNFQLNPIKDALWAPKSMHLTKENVVFYGPLTPESKIAQTLAAQK